MSVMLGSCMCAALVSGCSGGGAGDVGSPRPGQATASAPGTATPSTEPAGPGDVIATGVTGSDIEAVDGFIWAEDHASSNSVVRIDPQSGEASDPIPVTRPCGIAEGLGGLWVADLEGDSLVQIDPDTQEVAETFEWFDFPCDPVVGGGAVWVAVREGVARLDPTSGRVDVFPIEGTPADAPIGLAVFAGSLWVAPTGGEVLELDPQTGEQLGSIDAPALPAGLVAGGGTLWLLNEAEGVLARLNTRSGAVEWTAKIDPPARLLFAYGAVWTTSYHVGTLTKIDPSNGDVIGLVEAGSTPNGIAADGGALWVIDTANGDLFRFRPDEVR